MREKKRKLEELEQKINILEAENQKLKDQILQTNQVRNNVSPDSSIGKEDKPADEFFTGSEEQLRLITETISEAFWMSDYISERILYISSAYERIWGRTLQSLYENPRSYADAVHEDDKAIALTNFELKKTGQPWDLNYRIIRPDGALRWIWDRGYPIYDAKGQVKCYVGLSQDITERKLAEDELFKNEERYRLLFENTPVGIFSVNEEGQILEVNASLLKTLGSPSAEATKSINLFTFPLLVQAGISAEIKKCFETGQPVTGEKEYTSKWGKSSQIYFNAIPIFDKQNNIISAQTIIEDITERKLTEQALLESEEKFRNVFEHSEVGKSITSLDGSVYVNKALGEMLGYSREEMAGKKWQEITYPDDIEKTQNESDRLISGKVSSVRFTKRYLKKDGSIVWGDLSIVLQRDTNGEPLFFITTLMDITERIKAEEEIKKLNEQLEQRVKERTAQLLKTNKALNEAKQVLDAHMANSPLAVVEFDDAFRIIRWSGDAERVFGWNEEEVLGKGFMEFKWVVEEDMTSVVNVGKIMATHQQPNNLNINRNYRKDGNIITCEWYNSAIYDEKDNLKSVLALVLDVSHRKQMEEVVKDSDERIHKAFQIAPSMVTFCNPEDGKYIDVNDQFCILSGYNKDEVLGKTPLELGIFKARDSIDFTVQLEKYGKVKEMKMVLHTRDKSRIFLEVSAEKNKVQGKTMIVTIGRDITERSLREEALAESEEKFSKVFHSAPVMIALSRLEDGAYIEVNDQFIKTSKYTKDEVIGKTSMELGIMSAEDRHKIIPDLEKNGSADNIELVFSNKNRDRIICITNFQIIKIKGEKCLLTIAQDITARKQAEKALKESETKYQFIVENTDDMLWTMDGNLNITYVSPSVEKFMGYTPEEHYKLSVDDYFTPESAALVKNEFAEGMKNLAMKNYDKLRNFAELDCQFVRKDKTTGYCKIKMIMIRDEQHRITKIRGVTTDTTEQKIAEIALKNSESNYQFIVENTDDVLWTMDNNLKINYTSPSVGKFLGYTVEENMNQTPDDFLTPESAALIRQELAEGMKNLAMKNYDKLRNYIEFDCQFVRKDQTTGYCRIKLNITRDEQHRITKIRGVTTDTTREKSAELALQKSESLLNEAGEIAKIGGWEIDLEDNKLTWTKEVRRIHEVPYDYIPELESAINFYDEDSREIIRNAVDGAIQKGEPFDHELGFITAKGNHLKVRVIGHIKTDEDGKAIAVYGVFRDVTERYKARDQLKLYASMFQNLAEGIFITAVVDLTIKWTNPKFEKMYGYDEGEMIGMPVEAINAPGEKTPAEIKDMIFEELMKHGEWHGEVENIKKDGTHFWCYANISIFDHPQLGKTIISAHDDITERKRERDAIIQKTKKPRKQ